MLQEEKPPRVKPRLQYPPKIKEFYWCDFPKDAQLPEFWKRRPVIIISKNNKLYGTATVIPCSSKEQYDNKWALRLDSSIDGRNSWAICDKITTIAVSRLSIPQGGIVTLTQPELNNILKILQKWLPEIRE